MNINVALYAHLLILFAYAVNAGTYSLKFFSSTDKTIFYSITVNGVTSATTELEVTSPGSNWINFSASPGDTLSVLVHPETGFGFGLYYIVTNRPNGGGTQLYDSRVTSFTPVNVCPSGETSCSFGMVAGADTWGASTADIYINDVYLATFGGSGINFEVSPGDLIRIDFFYISFFTDVYYVLNYSDHQNIWYYNAFGENTLINNPLRSPFGTPYYPITQEQSDAFAVVIGAGKENLVWFPRE